jgi:cysteinyl-tRNA synthetase
MVLLFSLILACNRPPVSNGPEADGPTESSFQAPSPIPAATQPPNSPGFDKWSLWIDGPHLRGANIYQRRVYPELDGADFMGSGPVGPPFTQTDFDSLAALGANVVNISHPGLFTEEPPYTLDPEIQANLDNVLELIARSDMFAVIAFRTGPGRSEFTFFYGEDNDWFDASYYNDTVWQDQAAQDAWGAMWRYTAERYRDNPIVVGYDLMVEPNSNEVIYDLWDPEAFHEQYGGTLADWNQFHPRITAAIREVDTETPILVGGMGYSAVDWLPYVEPSDDPRTVYTVHQYAPFDYTHQEPGFLGNFDFSYPGEMDLDWDGEEDVFDQDWMENLLTTADDFAVEHNVPVAVNEFGVVRWVPGAAAFMRDQMDLLEERGMNYALWEWQTSWEPFAEEVTAFNFRYGSDPDSRREVESELMDVIIDHWHRNTIRPSTFRPPAGESPAHTLAEVTHWLYLIDVNLETDVVDSIAASTYDMVVLDFIPSERENTDYPMAHVVNQLHTAPHPKIVLAYIDVGEAEDYRTYWQPDWHVGNPEWIAGEDPDGWEGNYPVAYWYDEWREIWLGPNGTLQQILDAGFDGVYLDWIEAYSDENVLAIAEADDVDPVEEMIWWVEDISDFVKSRCPGCFVIGQNAPELAEYADYLAAIDAIAQEQVWFDGGSDNDPPGDCHLPRTEAEVDTRTYRDSLPRPCRRVYDDPDSTLHVSSEWYLSYLTLAQSRGVPIFTVDYALEPDNVAWVYATSRGMGFVPFVSNRALDRYVDPVP